VPLTNLNSIGELALFENPMVVTPTVALAGALLICLAMRCIYRCFFKKPEDKFIIMDVSETGERTSNIIAMSGRSVRPSGRSWFWSDSEKPDSSRRSGAASCRSARVNSGANSGRSPANSQGGCEEAIIEEEPNSPRSPHWLGLLGRLTGITKQASSEGLPTIMSGKSPSECPSQRLAPTTSSPPTKPKKEKKKRRIKKSHWEMTGPRRWERVMSIYSGRSSRYTRNTVADNSARVTKVDYSVRDKATSRVGCDFSVRDPATSRVGCEGSVRDPSTSRVGFDSSVRDITRDNAPSRVGFEPSSRVLLGGPVPMEQDEITRVGSARDNATSRVGFEIDNAARDPATSRVGFESSVRDRGASKVRFDNSVRDEKASQRVENSARDRANSGFRERAASSVRSVRSLSSAIAAVFGWGESVSESSPSTGDGKVLYSERIARAKRANQKQQHQAKAFSVASIMKKNNQYDQRVARAREANHTGKKRLSTIMSGCATWDNPDSWESPTTSRYGTPYSSAKSSAKDSPRHREERMMTARL